MVWRNLLGRDSSERPAGRPALSTFAGTRLPARLAPLSASSAVAAAPTTTPANATQASFRPRAGPVHVDRPSVDFNTVELFDSLVSCFAVHLDECETA